MAIRIVRIEGQTYVRLDDVVSDLRAQALTYVTELAGNQFASAVAIAMGAHANRLERLLKSWNVKPNTAEFKRR